MTSPRTLIVGLGSAYGDDQAGWRLADRLADHLDGELSAGDYAVRAAATPLQLTGWLGDIDRLVICDACRGLGAMGTFRCWSWPADELENARWSGSHDFPLPAVLQLADRLGMLPREVVIWAIEGGGRGELAELSAPLQAGIDKLVAEIVTALRPNEPCTNER